MNNMYCKIILFKIITYVCKISNYMCENVLVKVYTYPMHACKLIIQCRWKTSDLNKLLLL